MRTPSVTSIPDWTLRGFVIASPLVTVSSAWSVPGDAEVIALWSLPVHTELPAGEPVVGVLAYHPNGLEKVEFLFEGKVVATAYEETVGPVTGEVEFVGRLEGLNLKPGQDITLTARAYPRRGVITNLPPRLFHIADPASVSKWYVDARRGDDRTGDGSHAKPFRTIAITIAVAEGGGQILLSEGDYELMLPRRRDFKRFVTVRPAPEATARIVRVANPRCGMLRFEGLLFDRRKNNSPVVFGAYSAPHYWFHNCTFVGQYRFDNYTRTLKFWGKSTNITIEKCTFQNLCIAIVHRRTQSFAEILSAI